MSFIYFTQVDEVDLETFNLMVKYLLFISTYHQVPVGSLLDIKIKENLEKSGDATNIALWNWTPEQKSLLDANIPRVILTSYWSTGKTRIKFEKAKRLAAAGKTVIFVLHDVGFPPILLYLSLMNEIERSESNMKLMMSKNLEKDVLNALIVDKDVNIFIDEICLGCNIDAIHLDKNFKALNEICAKIDPKSYLWITIARLVNNHVPATDTSTMFDFDSWLSEKKTYEDFFVPSLLYPLRNSKEIVSCEASMGKVTVSNMRLLTHIGTQIAIIPTNLTMGTEPITIKYESSHSMDYNVQKCFQCLPTSRVVIIMVLRHSI